MPFLCSAYKADSSPQQERITCRGSCNAHKSGASVYRGEKKLDENSSQTFMQPAESPQDRNGRSDNCLEKVARFGLGFDVRAAAASPADHRLLDPSSSVTVVKRAFCTNPDGLGSMEIRQVTRSSRPPMSYAKYAQAFLCYVALNVVAAVFIGGKPIMPAFFASQLCGALTIIYWRITGTLPV